MGSFLTTTHKNIHQFNSTSFPDSSSTKVAPQLLQLTDSIGTEESRLVLGTPQTGHLSGNFKLLLMLSEKPNLW